MNQLPRSSVLKMLTKSHACRLCQSLTKIVANSWQQHQQAILCQRRSYSTDETQGPWTVHQLKSRGLIQLKGPDIVPFLQGLVTNDVTHLEQCKALYAMMLNVQGRVLYDLIIYGMVKENEDKNILVECDASVVSDLMKTLKMYKLRKKVDMTDISEQYHVYAALPPAQSTDNVWVLQSLTDLPVSAQDPRVDVFGWRIISLDEKSLLSSFESKFDVNIKPEELYHEARYRWGIGEGVTDLPPGNCFPLESNLVYMNGVCFQKGCYVGQELTARTYHTGATRKRLMPLVFERPPTDLKPGDSITTKSGKGAGKFRNAVGNFGLGLLRLANITGQLTATSESNNTYTLTTHIPSWWPEEETAQVKSSS